MGAYETLLVEPTRFSLRVKLNRPERQNSITDAMLADLDAVLDDAEDTPDCRVVVIEGVDDVFCTGMDFGEASGQPYEPDSSGSPGSAGQFFGLLRRFTETPRMVVSVVSGRVSGGGVGIAAASDFVIATPDASFSLPEALWGLLPCCVLPFLVRRVGFQKAYAMTLTTQPVTGTQAHSFQLVDELTTDPEAVLRRLAFRLSKLTTATLADAKGYFGTQWPVTPEMEGVAVEELERLLASPSVQEAIAGFAVRQEFPWNRRRGA